MATHSELAVPILGERYDFVLDARMDVAKYFIKLAGVGHVCRISKLYQVAELDYENSTNELDLSSVNYTSANRLGKVRLSKVSSSLHLSCFCESQVWTFWL